MVLSVVSVPVITQDASSGVITITQVYDDSPAKKAGIKAGDILYRVEEKTVTGKIWTKLFRGSKVKKEQRSI